MKKNFLKRQPIFNLFIVGLLFASCDKEKVEEQNPDQINLKPNTTAAAGPSKMLVAPAYQLIWSDEFNATGNFDAAKWQHCPRGTVAWNKYMTSLPAYASLDGANLLLRMDNATIAGDPVPYHSGGVESLGKFSLTYGKIEVRAKFTQGQGSWPAIWMMPDPATAHPGGWPTCGEIDIMEHVNNEAVVHQTVHTATVTNANGGSSASHSAAYNTTAFNIYTVEWSPTNMKFYVNNTLQYTFNRIVGGGFQQWPFDKPFYLKLNQAGGAGWPGPITNANLPFSMQVDYVRMYKLSQVGNGGFETTTISPWTTWGGTVGIVTGNARTGAKSLRQMGAESSLEQVITGLTPNTTYKFAGYAKVSAAGQSASIGVKNYGGSAVASSITSTSYALGSVVFTTGASNTSATVYFYKPGAGTVYGDDFYFEKQ